MAPKEWEKVYNLQDELEDLNPIPPEPVQLPDFNPPAPPHRASGPHPGLETPCGCAASQAPWLCCAGPRPPGGRLHLLQRGPDRVRR